MAAAPPDVPGAITTGDRIDSADPVVLSVRDVSKEFTLRGGVFGRKRRVVRAVDGMSFELRRGETLGLVGESGSGKTTVGNLVMQTIEPTAGQVWFEGSNLTAAAAAVRRAVRPRIQFVFQDPYASFDRLSTLGASLEEPLIVHRRGSRAERRALILSLVERVGLAAEHLERFPHQLSGGQLQRLAVARALVLDPEVIVCDEPVSALDVSVQAQVVNLLMDLQAERGLTYLVIAHDLAVVRHISDTIAVAYLGRIVEIGSADEVFARPRHPYTEALLSAIPVADPAVRHQRRRVVLRGDAPSPLAVPAGCRFHERCEYAMDVCRTVDPPAYPTESGGLAWCHLHTAGPVLAGETVAVLRDGGHPAANGDEPVR